MNNKQIEEIKQIGSFANTRNVVRKYSEHIGDMFMKLWVNYAHTESRWRLISNGGR